MPLNTACKINFYDLLNAVSLLLSFIDNLYILDRNMSIEDINGQLFVWVVWLRKNAEGVNALLSC
jgi:hypothetical protein